MKHAKLVGAALLVLGALSLALAHAPAGADVLAPAAANEADGASVEAPASSWSAPLTACGAVLLGAGALVLVLAAFPPGGRRRSL